MGYRFSGTQTSTIAGNSGITVVSIDDNEGDGKIDVTAEDDDARIYEADIDDQSVTFQCLDADAIARGDEGITSVDWNDGSATTIANSIVVGKSKAGSIGDRIVHNITVVPSGGTSTS